MKEYGFNFNFNLICFLRIVNEVQTKIIRLNENTVIPELALKI